MKTIVNILIIVAMVALQSCSSCDGENPSVKLINNGTGKADIQIKTTGGNTVNINNVLVGSESPKKSFDDGNIEFTINIQGVTNPVVYNLRISDCRDYIVSIHPDNSMTASSKERD